MPKVKYDLKTALLGGALYRASTLSAIIHPEKPNIAVALRHCAQACEPSRNALKKHLMAKIRAKKIESKN